MGSISYQYRPGGWKSWETGAKNPFMLRIALAALHLLALAIGFGSVWARANAVSEQPLDAAAGRRAIRADAWWGISALLWISTGLWRAIGATEKSTEYYTHNHVFFAKMGLFVLIFILETRAMSLFTKWRASERQMSDAWKPDAAQAKNIRAISRLEAIILMAMIVAAVMMARGYGA